jgi:hypothetical protein
MPSHVYHGDKCNREIGAWLRNFMRLINSTWPHPEHLLVRGSIFVLQSGVVHPDDGSIRLGHRSTKCVRGSIFVLAGEQRVASFNVSELCS